MQPCGRAHSVRFTPPDHSLTHTFTHYHSVCRQQSPTLRVEAVVCNSAPAVLFYLDNRLEGVITVDVVDDKITNFYAVRNPDKLAALTTAREISRG
jgi:hypothetical protein